MGTGLLDIIILGAIAAFLVLRLRSVLGKRTGHQGGREYDPFHQEQLRRQREEQARAGKEGGEEEKVVQLPDGRPGTPAEEVPADFAERPGGGGLTQIKLADRDFDPDQFLEGARGAFEMVVGAFAQGDVQILRPLLADDVYGDFAGAVEQRQQADERLETTLVGIKSADIIDADLRGTTAFVTVKFVSEQVNVTYDDEGRVVDGDPSEVDTITDIWTFARNTRSRDPNWNLVATAAPN
ncbi:Tim44/TimA family putative adaptor protein [Algihabitans albus]|uniref:Tim44/TimA family putative adaptor protein n=1 Tax=Algihabitans albus TaxID=2164067 RepID=UPI000E5D4982|nr:Tim44/TimA family putative adaptor protein [Algihabitans albus]